MKKRIDISAKFEENLWSFSKFYLNFAYNRYVNGVET